MTYAKLDDVFPEHPKVVSLSDAAFRVQVSGICYCAKLLTDGFVPEGRARLWPLRAVRELATAGLWEEVPGGYRIHDYLQWNDSKAEVAQRREGKAAGGRARAQQMQSRKTSIRSAGAGAAAQRLLVPPAAADAQHSSPLLSTPENPNPKTLARSAPKDELFEALAEACSVDWHHLTATSRGSLNKAVAEIKAAGDATPDEVRARVATYRVVYPTAAVTPLAIAKHWPALGNGAARRPGNTPVERAMAMAAADREREEAARARE